MKNLMLQIDPKKCFWDEKKELVKIQIDNSFDLGWKLEDMVLVTNFDYEYRGVKAITVDDSYYCDVHDKASKIKVIIYLLKNIVKPRELWWFHDFDAFQMEPIIEEELGLFNLPLAFTDHGWKDEANTGSIFFKLDSLRVFQWVRNVVNSHETNEQKALMFLTNKNYQYINNYYKKLNITYNFPACGSSAKHFEETFKMVDKPIKVIHFHPVYRRVNYIELLNNMDLISDKLMINFRKHLPDLCPKI